MAEQRKLPPTGPPSSFDDDSDRTIMMDRDPVEGGFVARPPRATGLQRPATSPSTPVRGRSAAPAAPGAPQAAAPATPSQPPAAGRPQSQMPPRTSYVQSPPRMGQAASVARTDAFPPSPRVPQIQMPGDVGRDSTLVSRQAKEASPAAPRASSQPGPAPSTSPARASQIPPRASQVPAQASPSQMPPRASSSQVPPRASQMPPRASASQAPPRAAEGPAKSAYTTPPQVQRPARAQPPRAEATVPQGRVPRASIPAEAAAPRPASIRPPAPESPTAPQSPAVQASLPPGEDPFYEESPATRPLYGDIAVPASAQPYGRPNPMLGQPASERRGPASKPPSAPAAPAPAYAVNRPAAAQPGPPPPPIVTRSYSPPPPEEDLKPTKVIEVPEFHDPERAHHSEPPPPEPAIAHVYEEAPATEHPVDRPAPARAEVVITATAELAGPAPSTGLALSRPGPMGLPTELRLEQAGSWQKIWLALQQREWTSVTLVPTGDELGDATVDIAQALGAVGLDHLRRPISVLDVRGVSLGMAETRIAELRSRVARGERVLVVTGPLDENPAEVPLANATDAAILCLKLGESRLSSAKRIVETLGRQRFLGAVALRPRPPEAGKKKSKNTDLAKG